MNPRDDSRSGIDLIIQEVFRPVLKKFGFKRKLSTWNRKRFGLIDVIELQKSKVIDKLTINVGIFEPNLHEIVWGKRAGAIVKEVDCIVRARVGEILDSDFTGHAHDKWWHLNKNDELRRVLPEMENILNDVIISFLEKFSSLQDIAIFLLENKTWLANYSLTKIQLAIIQIKIGKIDEGTKLLQSLIENEEGAWFERAKQVAYTLDIKT